jgi:G6PDH family F420-dependent oxidoreductase
MWTVNMAAPAVGADGPGVEPAQIGYVYVMRMGLFLQRSTHELLEQARLAADAGMSGLWISDHYHPWLDTQGQSAFVWSMIGAVSQVCDLPVMTAVTCPTVRVHPAIVAQAAATSAVLTRGRFRLGVGTGEALNESILGQVWPNAEVRREMLSEAIEVMRRLWTGEVVSHRGAYYTVQNARIYTLPEQPPPIYVSGGPRSPDSRRTSPRIRHHLADADLINLFRDRRAGWSRGLKACHAGAVGEAANRLPKWPTEVLRASSVRYSPPAHFEQVIRARWPGSGR